MRTLSVCLAALAFGSAFSLSALAAAERPADSVAAAEHGAPSELTLTAWPNQRLLLTGSSMLVDSYGATVIVTGPSQSEAASKLFLPAVGRWLDLDARSCVAENCGKDRSSKVGDGALQGFSALTVLLGLMVPESTDQRFYLIGNESLSLRPQVGMAIKGLTAAGRF